MSKRLGLPPAQLARQQPWACRCCTAVSWLVFLGLWCRAGVFAQTARMRRRWGSVQALDDAMQPGVSSISCSAQHGRPMRSFWGATVCSISGVHLGEVVRLLSLSSLLQAADQQRLGLRRFDTAGSSRISSRGRHSPGCSGAGVTQPPSIAGLLTPQLDGHGDSRRTPAAAIRCCRAAQAPYMASRTHVTARACFAHRGGASQTCAGPAR